MPEGQYVLLSRIRSFKRGEETVYCVLREAYMKLVLPMSWVSWYTFLGYVNLGCKRGEYIPLICFLHTACG